MLAAKNILKYQFLLLRITIKRAFAFFEKHVNITVVLRLFFVYTKPHFFVYTRSFLPTAGGPRNPSSPAAPLAPYKKIIITQCASPFSKWTAGSQV